MIKILVLSGKPILAKQVSDFLDDCILRTDKRVIVNDLNFLALGAAHAVFEKVGVLDPVEYENDPELKHVPLLCGGTPYAAACAMSGAVNAIAPELWLDHVHMAEDGCIVHGIETDVQAAVFVSAGYDVLHVTKSNLHLTGNYPGKWWIDGTRAPREIWRKCAEITRELTGIELEQPK